MDVSFEIRKVLLLAFGRSKREEHSLEEEVKAPFCHLVTGKRRLRFSPRNKRQRRWGWNQQFGLSIA